MLLAVAGFGTLSSQTWGGRAPVRDVRQVKNDDKCRDHKGWGRHDRRDDQCCDDDDRRDHGHRRWRDRWNRLFHHQDARQDDDNCSTDGGDDNTPGTVSGSVRGDNGAVSGWSVYLVAQGGSSPAATSSTGSDGSYSFSVAPGTYTVCEGDPSPDQEVLPANGSSASASPCAVGAGFGYLFTLEAGGAVAGLNFLNGSGGVAF
jgi:hypothetical protein